MKELKVKTSNLPKRCGTCYQQDLFHSVKNCCVRCNKTAGSDLMDNTHQRINLIENKNMAEVFIQRKKQIKKKLIKLLILSSLATTLTIVTLFNVFIIVMYLLPIDIIQTYFADGVIKIVLRVYIDIVTTLCGSLLEFLGIGVLETTSYLLWPCLLVSCYLWWYILKGKQEILEGLIQKADQYTTQT